MIQKLNPTDHFNLWALEFRATLQNEMPLAESAVPAAVSTPPITCSAVPGTSPAAASATALTTQPTAAVASTATAPLALILALPRKGIRTDIAKRSFHRVGLRANSTLPAPVATVIASPGPL